MENGHRMKQMTLFTVTYQINHSLEITVLKYQWNFMKNGPIGAHSKIKIKVHTNPTYLSAILWNFKWCIFIFYDINTSNFNIHSYMLIFVYHWWFEALPRGQTRQIQNAMCYSKYSCLRQPMSWMNGMTWDWNYNRKGKILVPSE